MKNRLFLLSFLCTVALGVTAQSPRYKIAIFAPLHLDSAFDGGHGYRFGKSFPKFLNPGLEFYQGAQAALDSLQRAKAPLDVYVYDSRSSRQSLPEQISKAERDGVSMLIGHSSLPEVRLLAEAAARLKAPYISATLPNDAGVTNNPYFVMLNSTLRTHVEGIYDYLKKTHAADKILLIGNGGAQSAQIREYLEEASKASGGTPLKMEWVEADENFSPSRMLTLLDSTRHNVCIAGSMDPAFGGDMLQSMAAFAPDYPLTVVGMPTWESVNLSRPEYKRMQIVYSSPFNYSRLTPLMSRINAAFTAKVNGRPTDMYYRGYETVLRFALLLLDAKKDVASHLGRKGNYVFTQFDIQPTAINRSLPKPTLDFFENKKLYWVKFDRGVRAVY